VAGATTEPRRSPGLGTRIFFATALLVVFAVGLAVLATYLMGTQVGDRAARRALERSSMVQNAFQVQRFEQLRLQAYLLAGDPAFAAYVLRAIEDGDVASLLDQLDERRQGLGFDFAWILDPEGHLVARTDQPGASGEELSAETLYLRAAEDYEAAGVWARDGGLFYAMAVPVAAGDLLAGYLVAAYAIDDPAALELREVNNTEVAFLLAGERPAVAAKTLSPGAAEELLAFASRRPELLTPAGDAPVQQEVELQRQKWLALARPLVDVAGNTVGAVIHLTSLDVELQPFRRIGQTLAAVGLLTMLLALAVSYLLPRRVLRPVGRLADAAAAAAAGDYDQEIEVERADEVGRLAGAFNVLLSELRDKRDMELYVTELARTLPDPDSAAPEAAPVEERQLTLLGVELRNYAPAKGFDRPAPREALDRLTRDLRGISRAVSSRDGRIEAVLGHRLAASFEGPRRSDRALQAAAEIVAHAGRRGYEIAVALVAGSAVSGTATWDNRARYVLTGEPVEALESLLRVAPSGGLLLSSAAREALDATFEEAGVEPRRHRSTVSELPLFSLDAETTFRFTYPGLAATQVMAETEELPQAVATLSGIGPGSVLGDRFEILSELGAGGMGVVYKARDRALGELVALKMLKQELWGDAERLERLKDELKLARKISHPNVLRTFDFGDADGHPFISMEFVRGVTLRKVLERSGRLPLSAGLHTARQLCRGLAAAHAQGVLHRDIKPENLIIEASGNVKLMDFGIARPLERVGPGKTRAGVIIGTPHYLAPEQLEGGEADERADLYSCGMVLYEIFTGTLPFPAVRNLMELITRKLQEPPAPPRKHWPAMPEALERIILRCLESEPEQRFADVSTLLRELEALRA
jgi:serine/threonine-protein kinase